MTKETKEEIVFQLMQEIARKSETEATIKLPSVAEYKKKRLRHKIGRFSAIAAAVAGVGVGAYFLAEANIIDTSWMPKLPETTYPARKYPNGLKSLPEPASESPTKPNDTPAEPTLVSNEDQTTGKKNSLPKNSTRSSTAETANLPTVDNRDIEREIAAVRDKTNGSGEREAKSPSTSPSSARSMVKIDMQVMLFDFYKAIQSRNLDKINAHYAFPVAQYFDQRDLSKEQLTETLRRKWEKTAEEDITVDWDTFKYTTDSEGNLSVSYQANRMYRQSDTDWKQQKVSVRMKLTPDLKIISLSN